MKTIALVLIAFLGSAINLNATADMGYLVTESDTLLVMEVRAGIKNVHVTLVDGEKQKIRKNSVRSFYINGKKFDRMPEYINGKPTGRYKFMEQLCQRNGLKLYMNTFYCCGGWNSAQQSIDAAGEKINLLVYKDDKFYLQLDKGNADNLVGFFHLKGLRFE